MVDEELASAPPLDLLRILVSQRLISARGEVGLSEALKRIAPFWRDLETAWQGFCGTGAAQSLGLQLLRASRAGDGADLTGTDLRLRNTFTTYAGTDFSIEVASIIARCILDGLSRGKKTASRAAAEAIAGLKKVPGVYDHVFLGNLVVAEIGLDECDYDTAVSAARRNLRASTDPTSQRKLYLALKAKRDAGEKVDSTDINLDDLTGRFCSRPFDTLSTGTNGRNLPVRPTLHACMCPTSLPYPLSGETIEEAWNGLEAQELRRSILDGSFKYCSRATCELIANRQLPARNKVKNRRMRTIIDSGSVVVNHKPATISLGHDPSCNLACPSCRTEIMTVKGSERSKFEAFARDDLLPFLRSRTADDPSLVLIASNDGDPLYSKSYREVLEILSEDEFPNLSVGLLTNGVLFTDSMWNTLRGIHRIISFVGVSIDAAEKDTYEDLRRPAKWETITKNMELIAGLRRAGILKYLALQFVVQKKNYRQMSDFIRLGNSWGADRVVFIRLFNPGTFSGDTLFENDVANPDHPLHPDLLDRLRHPIFQDPIVDLFTVNNVTRVSASFAGLAAQLRHRLSIYN